MPNIIGGNLANSFLSKLVFVPYAGVQTFTKLSALSSGGDQFSFDVVTAQPKIIRHLDNATHTGLWFHRGRRQTARDGELAARLKWDIDAPPDSLLGFVKCLTGFQLYAVIGSNAQTMGGQGNQYYWLPSVFAAPETIFIDVNTTPPRLVELDLTIEPNSPSFYVDESSSSYDSSAITDFLAYLVARDWGF